MKSRTAIIPLILMALLAISLVFQRVGSARRATDSAQPVGVSRNDGARSVRANSPVPVIVELFTSEGCSSCPPADALLMQLEREQPVPGAEVLALEEHVDYWNGLGWADPFSSYAMTERQQVYAEAFRQGGPYTPQMVVNGQWEFVGSRSREAREAIAQGAQQAQSAMSINAASLDSSGRGEWTVSVPHLDAASGDTAEVWLAITETRLHSSVAAGENSGRNVEHAALVRQFLKLGNADAGALPSFSGTAKITLRPEWNRQNLRAVAFVQQKKSRHILGAASARIAP